MKQALIFRFDASKSIGLGHAYRSMALIEKINLEKLCHVIVFTKQMPIFLIEKLQGFGAKVYWLDEQLSIEQEILKIKEISHHINCKSLILDGYQFNDEYRKKLSLLPLQISCFDDVNDLNSLHCDLVINALPSAHLIGYDKSAPIATKLLGLSYSIIRQEFIKATSVEYHNRKSILVNFGGSDVLNFTIPTIKALISSHLINHHKVVVVTGGAFEKETEVQALCLRAGFEHIHNCKKMSTILHQCKLAICAPGAIIYELAYCGVPSVFITVADNQLLSAEAHQHLGWCQVVDGQDVDAVEQAIKKSELLCDDTIKLTERSVRASSLVDGHGVDRIIDALTH